MQFSVPVLADWDSENNVCNPCEIYSGESVSSHQFHKRQNSWTRNSIQSMYKQRLAPCHFLVGCRQVSNITTNSILTHVKYYCVSLNKEKIWDHCYQNVNHALTAWCPVSVVGIYFRYKHQTQLHHLSYFNRQMRQTDRQTDTATLDTKAIFTRPITQDHSANIHLLGIMSIWPASSHVSFKCIKLCSDLPAYFLCSITYVLFIQCPVTCHQVRPHLV